jgi:hypothetical protein
MELKITTRNKAVANEILQGDKELRLPRDIFVEFKGVEFKKSLDAPEIVAFLISVGAQIPASLAADIITAWILGRFRGQAEIEMLSIDETEIKFSKSGKLKKIIKRSIKKARH